MHGHSSSLYPGDARDAPQRAPERPCGRDEITKQAGVVIDLIDICTLSLPTDDAGEAIKDDGFSFKMDRAGGLVIVAPEYNHGYTGLLKHVWIVG